MSSITTHGKNYKSVEELPNKALQGIVEYTLVPVCVHPKGMQILFDLTQFKHLI